MSERVVVTGLGVVAPNANDVREFELALRKGRSGIRPEASMSEKGFACQVAGVPQGIDEIAEATFAEHELLAMNSSQRFCALAALQAWAHGGLARPQPKDDRVDWGTGAVLGTGIGGMDTIASRVVPLVSAGKTRRLGSTIVEQVMASGISARVAGLLGLGNQVTSNSSACATGAEAIAMGALRIRTGAATRMLCGGSEGASPYLWAGFDSMRVLCRAFNDQPEKASRPMSASAAGFVPGAGAGVLLLESRTSALERGARILAEVAGFAINCGGQRAGGSMTAPNPDGVVRCIRQALADAQLGPDAVHAISGHLTATQADPGEVDCWARALDRGPGELPPITSTKSLIGHTLGAAGAIESVASVLMLEGAFVHASLNCEDLHPRITPYADAIPHETREIGQLNAIVKAGFGFGDVNTALVFVRPQP